MPTMSEVTRVIDAIQAGDSTAANELLPLVYDQLRQLAEKKLSHERAGQTLTATALVHEAYMKLVNRNGVPQDWEGRRHFFAAAAQAMRRILINRARDKMRFKRGGHRKKIPLDLASVALDEHPVELVALDDAIERLTQENPVLAELVKLRFYAGLSLGDAAKTLGIGRRTADRYWAYARAWLFREIRGEEIESE